MDVVAPESLAATEFSGEYGFAGASARAATVFAFAHQKDRAWSFALVVDTRAAWHFVLHEEENGPVMTEMELRDRVFEATGTALAADADIVVGARLPQGSASSPADSAFVLAMLANRIARLSPLDADSLLLMRYLDGPARPGLASALSAQIVALGGSLGEAALFGRSAAMSHVFRLGYVPQRALAWLDNERKTRRLFESATKKKPAAARPQA